LNPSTDVGGDHKLKRVKARVCKVVGERKGRELGLEVMDA